MYQGSSGAGEGFEVTKFGHGRVALIGFPRYANFVIKIFVHSSISRDGESSKVGGLDNILVPVWESLPF